MRIGLPNGIKPRGNREVRKRLPIHWTNATHVHDKVGDATLQFSGRTKDNPKNQRIPFLLKTVEQVHPKSARKPGNGQ